MPRHDETRRPLDQFVERAGRLYTLPAVAVAVLRLTQEARVDVAELTRCIERDPALVGKILRTVNSSLFGLGREVTDLQQAVGLLGIKPLKLLVLGFSLPPKLLGDSQQAALSRYWQHALVKAVAARQLAQQAARVDGDDAFLAGLLQDIGELVLLKDLGEPYARFIERAHSEQLDLLSLELDTLGFDHRLLSARLLAAWGLPEAFCKTIALAVHSPSVQRLPAALREIPPLLVQAEALAQVAASGRSDALAALAQRDDRADPATWLAFVDGLREKVDELARVLDLSLPQGAAHDELLARAHQQLAGQADLAAIAVCRQSQAGQWQETESLVAAAARLQNVTAVHHTDAASTAPSPFATGESPVANVKATLVVDDPGLGGLAARAVAECRRRRAPLSLMLIEFDEFDELVFPLGLEKATALVRKFAAQATEIVVDAHSTALGEGQFALLLHGSDRQQTVAVARRLMQLASAGGRHSPHDEGAVTLSIGIATVAMPAKNFPAADLVAAAQRCLFGASSGGGNGVKSIDIY
jgi:HD-like signal output (HDOD) protein/GGDEF domain-containing protein